MTSLSDNRQKGIIFNIQKYSLHDGEGIRTLIFLKGCSLVCGWCSNPESQEILPQLGYNPAKCLTTDECSRCGNVCEENALTPGENGLIEVDWKKCTNCLECADVCPSGALSVYGYEITVEEVMRRVEEDSMFYLRSGGGMTLSGGEPLMQGKFAVSLLREARKRRINTCIETCGNISWAILDEAAQYLNEVYYDLKVMDGDLHKKFTGFDNALIIDNLTRLTAKYPNLKVKVRTPLIPGLNDSKEAVAAILEFIKPMPGVTFELLEYHRMGTPKYRYLGREYPLEDAGELGRERFQELVDYARSYYGAHTQSVSDPIKNQAD